MTMLREPQKRREARKQRHLRVRKKITGTESRPRLSIFRSAKHIYSQVIDDTTSTVVCSASTTAEAYKKSAPKNLYPGNVAAAQLVGKQIAELALQKGVKEVVFDKGGYRYHGRIKALADAAREAGLVF